MQVYGSSHHPISSHLITPHFSETSVYVQNIPRPLPSLQIPSYPQPHHHASHTPSKRQLPKPSITAPFRQRERT
jgi:hypothetical protein